MWICNGKSLDTASRTTVTSRSSSNMACPSCVWDGNGKDVLLDTLNTFVRTTAPLSSPSPRLRSDNVHKHHLPFPSLIPSPSLVHRSPGSFAKHSRARIANYYAPRDKFYMVMKCEGRLFVQELGLTYVLIYSASITLSLPC